MAEVTNAYAEATGRTTTTSTSVGGANKVRLTHTPGSSETWAYLWDSIVDCSSTGSDVLMRLRNETLSEDWANVNVEPKDGTNRMSVGGVKVKTYGASPGSQDIDIDFWNEAATTAGAGGTFLWGIKLGANDKSAEDDSQQNDSSGASTFVTALTLTETLTGDYLFLCSCEYQVAALANILIRADKSGTKYGDFQARLQDATSWRTWATGFKLTGLSGSQTVTIEFATDLDTVQASVRKCRILAIDLSRFNKNGYQEDRTRDTNSTATPEDQSSLAFTPDATRNHIAICGMILDHNVNTTNGFGEFERDGTAINQCQEEPQQNGDCFAFFSLRRESLSAATTYKTQKWSETTNITGAAESWIIVIDLEEAAVITPVTGQGLQHIGYGIGDTGAHAGRAPQTLHTIDCGIMS